MFLADRQTREVLQEPAAELGQVTVSGEKTGVALAGERRNVTRCGPGGYHWAPARGDTVLVIKCGPEQAPCVAGQVDGADLEPGEVFLSVASGAGIRLKPDGRVQITGTVTVNGKEV